MTVHIPRRVASGPVGRRLAAVLVLAVGVGPAPATAATSAKDLYTRALARERVLRDASANPGLKDFRALIAQYERIVWRYPRSGYSDNALWQAAGIALLAYERFHDPSDRRNGERLAKTMRAEYPSSSLVPRVPGLLKDFESAGRAIAEAEAAAERARRAAAAAKTAAAAGPSTEGAASITQISHSSLQNGERVVIELDGEVAYREEQLANPPRVFFDFRGATAPAALAAELAAARGDLIREIRVGKHPDTTTRVVMELSAEPRYTVFALFDPYRLVIDFARPSESAAGAVPAVEVESTPPDAVPAALRTSPPPPPPLEATRPVPPTAPAPSVPSANDDGKFSLARQLGLGIARIVIDPGHGGHDPGAKTAGLTEANTVLDIALRLEKLLLDQPGIEVVMTRRTDVFVPLEERTAIANRENADLFLSIHANASRNRSANGVETYFLNFASNPEAEAVAARENSASGGAMHNLPDIVRAIALNNKLDESRDFARMVQEAMIRRMKAQHKAVRNLGVKQAPFVVLIGAQMPSVLAEVSFITNKTELGLLKKSSYRQRIAEALFDAIVQYQKSLKNTVITAQQ